MARYLQYITDCEYCGNKFTSTRKDAKFCSSSCRGKFHYSKKLDKKYACEEIKDQEKEEVMQTGGEIKQPVYSKPLPTIYDAPGSKPTFNSFDSFILWVSQCEYNEQELGKLNPIPGDLQASVWENMLKTTHNSSISERMKCYYLSLGRELHSSGVIIFNIKTSK